MSGKNVIFDDKKIKKKKDLYKTSNVFEVDDIDVNKVLVSKKNHMVQKAHLNTSPNIMIMMSLDHFV